MSLTKQIKIFEGIMISINNINLAFGEQKLFESISGTINEHDRIGLIGRNGSGKSTLLKAIAGQQYLDDGKISISRSTTIAYLPQEITLNSEKSVIDETFSAAEEVYNLEQEKIIIEKELELNHDDEKLLEKYAQINDELSHANPAVIKAEAQRILLGLGFQSTDLEKKVNTLSIGWKMRIVLAKLLLKKADFYLFDEPTNHLDIVAKEWFLHFLKRESFGFMLVCHDKYFLDHVCEKILDLEIGKATFYTGNYAHAIQQKEQNLEQLTKAYEQQQRDISQKMATVNRFRASASKAKSAQSMLKAIDKIERIELPPSPPSVNIQLPPIKQPGKIVISIQNISHQFGTKKIFEHISLEIERGQKVAIIAPNGVGKTTLLNLIARNLPLQSGSIIEGHNVSIAKFGQDQTQELNGNKTILENILLACPHKHQSTIRNLLGSFLFSGDAIEKKVNILSGGEKNRVGMVKVLLQESNVLLLDEPTNHLDIPSKEILLKALQQSQATIIFVSHDQDFINHLATHIIELTAHGAFTYEGNYEAYLYHKKHTRNPEPEISNIILNQPLVVDNNKKSHVSHDQAKKIKKLEAKIDKTEKEITACQQEFAHFTYNSPEFHKETKKLSELKKQLETLFEEWSELI